MRMTETLNYREFYQKRPFHICENDAVSIRKEAKYTDVHDYTHWLIGLEGCEQNRTTFQWRVVVFPSSETGHFNCKLAFFKSPFVRTFNEACELMRNIEALARQDQLFTLYENI
jgi:hypothetical protein